MNAGDRALQQAETYSPGRESDHHHEHQYQYETERLSSLSTRSSSDSFSSSVDRYRSPRLNSLHSRNTELDLERQRTTASQALSRIETGRIQHALTVGGESVKSRLSTKGPLPPFGDGKPYPPHLPEREDYVVGFDGPGDPTFPQNWPLKRKVLISAILAYTSLCSTFDSAVFSPSASNVSKEFSVGLEVATISSTLYIVGYASGPLFWAPFSELKGRRIPIIIGMLGFGIFNTAVAVAKDLQTLMICRFFCGIFGSSPLAVVAAVFSDMYNNRTRGVAISIFSGTVFLGPLLAPFIGGFINMSYLGWRWTAWVPAFMGYAAFVLNLFVLQESYPPVVLVEKASHLRRRTKNWGIHAKQEEIELDLRELIVNNLSRPIRMLISEPLILAVTVYLSFIYGLLYCFLTAYTLVFSGVHGMNQGVGGLPLFGMVVGLLIAAAFIILSSPAYNKKLDANNGITIPEWRLPPVMIGGVMFTMGLFWFGWTGFTDQIPWIVPTLSGLFTGFGLLMIFIQLFNYLIDTYLILYVSQFPNPPEAFETTADLLKSAASAIAANTFCRSMLAASFPLFSRQMFNGMGIQWAGTLLGCVSAVLVPIPVVFYFYGKQLRMKSSFAPYFEPMQESCAGNAGHELETVPEQEMESAPERVTPNGGVN